MAFATKYRCSFTAADGTAWRVEFQEDSFAGTITNLEPGPDPIVITYHRTEKYQPVVGSSVNISVKYESAVDGLYTEENQDIKVLIQYGLSNTTYWAGYLLPGEYKRLINLDTYFVELTATDELGQLKFINFEDNSGDPVYYQQKEWDVVVDIIAKTGLALNIYEAVNVYEDSHNTTDADTAMDQTYFFPEMYYDAVNDTRGKCYDVLGDILKGYGAYIFQHGGAWYINRVNQQHYEHTRRRYSSSGTYDNNTNTDPVYDIDGNLTYVGVDAEITKHPSVKDTRVALNDARRDNLIYNSSFNEFTWSGADPLHWTNSGASYGFGTGNNVIRMASNGSSSAPTNYIYQQNYVFNTVDSIKIRIRYRAVYSGSPTYARIRMQFIIGSKTLDNTDTWGTSTFYDYDLIADSKSSMTDYEWVEITLPPIYDNNDWRGNYVGTVGLFELRIYEFWNETGGATNYLEIDYISADVSYIPELKSEFIYSTENTSLDVSDVFETEVSIADAESETQAIAYNAFIYYCKTTSTGLANPTSAWSIKHDETAAATFLQLLSRQYKEGFHRSLDKLRASFYGSLDFDTSIRDSRLTDSYGFMKVFMPLTFNYNVIRKYFYGDWIEVAPEYTDEGLEWDSHDFGANASISTNTITINDTAATLGDQGFFEEYRCTVGQPVRIKITLTDTLGLSDMPLIKFDGVSQTVTWGDNYFNHIAADTNLQIVLEVETDGDIIDLSCTIVVYSLTGI